MTYETMDASSVDLDVDDVLIPALTGPQRQGDVYVWPVDMYAHVTLVARDTRDVHPSVDVVDAGTARHAHTLTALAGQASWTPGRSDNGLAIGTLTVVEGAVCYLSHDEHNTLAVGSGSYVVTRQREQADEQRLVAD